MTPSNRPAAAAQCCDRCGGSGVLRLDDQRFRTCLDCLGQGRRPAVPPAPTTAVLQQRVVLQQGAVLQQGTVLQLRPPLRALPSGDLPLSADRSASAAR